MKSSRTLSFSFDLLASNTAVVLASHAYTPLPPPHLDMVLDDLKLISCSIIRWCCDIYTAERVSAHCNTEAMKPWPAVLKGQPDNKTSRAVWFTEKKVSCIVMYQQNRLFSCMSPQYWLHACINHKISIRPIVLYSRSRPFWYTKSDPETQRQPLHFIIINLSLPQRRSHLPPSYYVSVQLLPETQPFQRWAVKSATCESLGHAKLIGVSSRDPGYIWR